MAVSLSTGGSGYPRSDFMISDAAMPMRLEEAAVQAEQTERFSQVLSGIGEADTAQSVPAEDAAKLMKDFIGEDGRVDFHRLAKAVAEGEVRLDEIPEELLTGALFEELTKFIEKPEIPDEDTNDPSSDPAVQEMMSELAVFFTSQQSIKPDAISDKSAELSQLSVQPAVEAVQDQQIPQPVQVQSQPENVLPEEVQPEEASLAEVQSDAALLAEIQPEAVIHTKDAAAVPQEKVTQTEQVKATPEESSDPLPQTKSEVQAAPISSSNADQQSSQDSAEFTGQNSGSQQSLTPEAVKQAPEVRQSASEEAERSIPEFTEVTVTKQEKTSQNTQEAKPEETAIFTDRTAQRSRVVSKSDEFEMIKGADTAKTTSVQPQTVQTERPVIFTRADGEQITVKPAEIAQQVADRIVERAADLKEGTEEYTVTLNPEDLGRITVKMTKTADGAVSVSVAAENSRTLRMIEENGTHIQESLKQNGIQLESWQTVSESKQEAHAQDYQGSSRNPYRESDRNDREEEPEDGSFAELIASM